MADYRFERQSRTPSSEQYLIREGDQRVGRLDLHFTQTVVHATLAVEERLTEDEIMDLIDLVDEDLVSASDVPRDDFVIAVYQGRELGVYSDDFFEGEGSEEEDEE